MKSDEMRSAIHNLKELDYDLQLAMALSASEQEALASDDVEMARRRSAGAVLEDPILVEESQEAA